MKPTERLRAEQAMDAIAHTTDPRTIDWPSAASRIRNARLKAGLDESAIAGRMGCSVDSYCDLEAYDDEVFTVATVKNLVTLGKSVGVEPRRLLLGEEADKIERTITFSDITRRLSHSLADHHLNVEELEGEIGFRVEQLLLSAEALWECQVEALYRICKTLNMDWVSALPDLATNNE